MKHWCFILVFLTALKRKYCERLSDQIYLDLIGGRYSCFRLLNGTHQIGCASEEDGNEGVVIFANNEDELINFIMSDEFADAIITAFDISLLNERTIEALKEDRVHGIILFHDDSDEKKQSSYDFSEDAVCPNEQFGIYEKCENQWNRRGALLPEGFRFINWKKPIFVIENRTEIEIIKKYCYDAFNSRSLQETVLCSARMTHFMRAAGNAEICLRRQELFYGFSDASISLCDPLEDKNLFATIPAFAKNFKPRILFLSARMDSFSSFTEAAVGEVSVLTSLISLLAVAQVIGNYSSELEAMAQHNKRAVIFAFFHGESLGYIGSSATVNDITKRKFPLNIQLEDIDYFIEVQQLDGSESVFSAIVDSTFYNTTENKSKVKILLNFANSALRRKNSGNEDEKIICDEGKSQLPPSSYQSFLKKKHDLAGFILRPFGQQYVYNRINSLVDQNVFKNNTVNLKKQIVAAASSILGTVVGYLSGDNETDNEYISYLNIDESFVSVLLDCFLNYPNWHTCGFFKSITKGDNRFQYRPKETYISAGKNNYSLIRLLMNALLVNTLGSKTAVNVPDRSHCEDLNKHQKVYHYTWQFDPTNDKFACYKNSLFITNALSPSFMKDDYDLQSGMYSTWVESVWATKQFKLFLTIHPSPVRDFSVFLCGLTLLFISFIVMEIIYMGNKESIEPIAAVFEAECYPAPL